MSTPVFSFSENPYLNGTEGSYKKMNIISADTYGKLHGEQANPLINPLFLFFSPFRATMVLKYNGWKSKKAAYRSKTAKVYELLSDLSSTKIENFDVRIQVVYPRDSVEYLALLPNHRIPFQSGEIDERISALGTLVDNIGTDLSLAAVKTDVDAFLTLLNDARVEQTGLEEQVSAASAQLELERVKCAEAMYYVLGGLMQVFNSNTSEISRFFDLETLRGHIADTIDLIFDGSANGNTIVNVLGSDVLQYVPGVTLRIKNTTTGPAIGGLFFYAADNATDGWNGLGQQLNPGQEATITLTAAQFRAFFNVQNQGPNLQTYEVEIILPE